MKKTKSNFTSSTLDKSTLKYISDRRDSLKLEVESEYLEMKAFELELIKLLIALSSGIIGITIPVLNVVEGKLFDPLLLKIWMVFFLFSIHILIAYLYGMRMRKMNVLKNKLETADYLNGIMEDEKFNSLEFIVHDSKMRLRNLFYRFVSPSIMFDAGMVSFLAGIMFTFWSLK